jgi:hypothetical protein
MITLVVLVWLIWTWWHSGHSVPQLQDVQQYLEAIGTKPRSVDGLRAVSAR